MRIQFELSSVFVDLDIYLAVKDIDSALQTDASLNSGKKAPA